MSVEKERKATGNRSNRGDDLVVKLKFRWAGPEGPDARKPKLTAADLLLLLLGAGKVSGRTMLQKQVFLAYKEVFSDRVVMDPGFRPDRFGPYSQLVADLPPLLKSNGLVAVRAKGEGHSTYYLGPSGKELLPELETRPTVASRLTKLRAKKASWDEWSTRGIMQYVYRNYPQYATKTAIPSLIWE